MFLTRYVEDSLTRIQLPGFNADYSLRSEYDRGVNTFSPEVSYSSLK